jgi:hypothetical protein
MIAVVVCFVMCGFINEAMDNGIHLFTFIDVSNTTRYRGGGSWRVSDRDEFKGDSVSIAPNTKYAVFSVANRTKHPFDFKDAVYYAKTKNWFTYKLKVADIANGQYGRNNSILNPNDSITITCELPKILADNSSDITGFKIKLGRNNNIRFGYIPRPFLKNFYDNLKPRIK